MHYVVGYLTNNRIIESERFSDTTEAHEHKSRLSRRMGALNTTKIFIRVGLSPNEKRALRRLAKIHGGPGRLQSMEQLGWITDLVEKGEDNFKHYRKGISRDCEHAVLRALGRMV